MEVSQNKDKTCSKWDIVRCVQKGIRKLDSREGFVNKGMCDNDQGLLVFLPKKIY